MENNKLNFLDTTVILKGTSSILKQYRKSESSDCLINFKYGVAPKAYKISTLIGEIYRANNCTTTKDGLDQALKNIEKIFEKNLFPKNLIKSKFYLI